MKRMAWKQFAAGLLQGIFLLYTTIICVGPFLWVIISSFKTNKEILDSAFALPSSYSFDGYARALDMSPIFHFFGNSVWISVINTVISVLVVAMAASAVVIASCSRIGIADADLSSDGSDRAA